MRDKIKEPVVGHYVIVGIGAQAPGPIEKTVATAVEAEVERSVLERLCGKRGTVEVLGRDGRSITPGKLRRLALAETMSGGTGSENAEV